MKSCLHCDHEPVYQSAGDEVEDYCPCCWRDEGGSADPELIALYCTPGRSE